MLARQFLLARSERSPSAVLEHLIGLQAQAPHPPYVGLWTRVAGFQTEHLERMILDRQAVRIALMRSTIHLVTADDCLRLRPLLQPVIERGLRGAYGKHLAGLDVARLLAAAEPLFADRALTFAEAGTRLRRRFPKYDAHALGYALRAHAALVQVPPRGLWGPAGKAAHTTVAHWLGRPPGGDDTVGDLIRRYLAAFGPASVRDVQAWSGFTRLQETMQGMTDLERFSAEDGTPLYDLVDGARPPGDTPAPVRFLPEWDNLLVSYADRSRILAPEHRKHVFTPNGLIPGTVLVDGFAGATWRLDRAAKECRLEIRPFGRIDRAMRVAIAEEGELLLRFAAAPGAKRKLRFAPGS
jgi:hypothetical protein